MLLGDYEQEPVRARIIGFNETNGIVIVKVFSTDLKPLWPEIPPQADRCRALQGRRSCCRQHGEIAEQNSSRTVKYRIRRVPIVADLRLLDPVPFESRRGDSNS